MIFMLFQGFLYIALTLFIALKSFLISECSQRAGLELMDMMAVYQEGAYERLCR